MSTTGQLFTTWRYPSVIRGYHVYKDIWVAVEDEMLDCTREAANRFNPYCYETERDRQMYFHCLLYVSEANRHYSLPSQW